MIKTKRFLSAYVILSVLFAAVYIAVTPRQTSAAPNLTCSLLGDQILVANTDNTVVRHNIDTDTTIDASYYTLAAGFNPHEMLAVTDTTLWQANDTSVTPVDIASGTTGALISVGGIPFGMTVGPDGRVYSSVNSGGGTAITATDPVSPFTTTTVIAPGTGGLENTFNDGSMGLEFGPDGDLYTTVTRDDAGTYRSRVKRYDGTTFAYIGDFTAEYPVTAFGQGWTDIEFHTDGYLYVATFFDGVFRFDATTGAFVDQYSTLPDIFSIDFDSNGDLIAAVLNSNVYRLTDGDVNTVIHTSTTAKTVYVLPPACYDYGDAADSTVTGGSITYSHPVRIADNGARHLIHLDPRAGATEDDESDGQPTADADGDDATDDEDSITGIPVSVLPSTVVNATFTAYGRGETGPVNCMGYLNLWVDLNGDGDWNDVGEQVIDGGFLGTACTMPISFTPTATDGPIMIRSRYSSVRDLAPTGGAPDGEVEDYVLGITSTPTYSIGNRVWLDNGVGGGTANNGIIDGTEVGIATVTVNLYEDANNDGVVDGASIATQTTDSSGYYRFDGLDAGRYIVAVVHATLGNSSYVSSTGQATTNTPDSRDHAADSQVSSRWQSHSVLLGVGLQPTDETDITTGQGGESPDGDASSNLAIDFGFHLPAVVVPSTPSAIQSALASTGQVVLLAIGFGAVVSFAVAISKNRVSTVFTLRK